MPRSRATESLVFKSFQFPVAIKVMSRGGDMALELLAATVVSIDEIDDDALEQSGGKIKSLALDGVARNEANVAAGADQGARGFLVNEGTVCCAVWRSRSLVVRGADGKRR